MPLHAGVTIPRNRAMQAPGGALPRPPDATICTCDDSAESRGAIETSGASAIAISLAVLSMIDIALVAIPRIGGIAAMREETGVSLGHRP
jgi:hypothetical protein